MIFQTYNLSGKPVFNSPAEPGIETHAPHAPSHSQHENHAAL